MEREDTDISLVMQAELLGLNRPGLHHHLVGPFAQERHRKGRIDEISTAH